MTGLSDPTLVFCLSDTPGPPADKIVISRVTEEKCTVSWKIPLEDGGDTVTHYIVERRETSRLNWVIMETECKTLSCVSSRLIKNNEYIFRVRGVNKFGPGIPLESDPIIARNAYSKLQHFSGNFPAGGAIGKFFLILCNQPYSFTECRNWIIELRIISRRFKNYI